MAKFAFRQAVRGSRKGDTGMSGCSLTLLCGQQQWRVAYAYLHRVVDADSVDVNAIGQNVLEFDVMPIDGK
jgi:hypothetical protein